MGRGSAGKLIAGKRVKKIAPLAASSLTACGWRLVGVADEQDGIRTIAERLKEATSVARGEIAAYRLYVSSIVLWPRYHPVAIHPGSCRP